MTGVPMPRSEDMRRGSTLLKAYREGNTLAMQAALAHKDDLPRLVTALILAIDTGFLPTLNPVVQMNQWADEIEQAETAGRYRPHKPGK